MNSTDIKKIMDSPVATQWMTICLSKDSAEDKYAWLDGKRAFWGEHRQYLEESGFFFAGEMDQPLDMLQSAIDRILAEYSTEDIPRLVLIRLGTTENPASVRDIDLGCKILEEALAKIDKIRVALAHHAISFERINGLENENFLVTIGDGIQKPNASDHAQCKKVLLSAFDGVKGTRIVAVERQIANQNVA